MMRSYNSTGICSRPTNRSFHPSPKDKKKNFASFFIFVGFYKMAASAISSGALVMLEELNPSSTQFKQGASIRVTGKLQEFNVEEAVAVLADGSATLRVDTQHLNLSLRMGSIYQFIGELQIDASNEVKELHYICDKVDHAHSSRMH
ncbi:CST complex subunit TEN1 [Olea europaea var. sylvestris]|uniref:CST complex subunit TEN1 n=1 Tax=Olea europaea var. sylvestris TaxID=158386 RepID=UPI000C1D2867|nr:CST complex subunit TEN1 [Olea europaea var. sylvestris]